MTRSEQHKLIQELKYFAGKMSKEDSYAFEMMLKRDKDDEDLDEASVKKLEQLHAAYAKKRSVQEAEEKWKKLTGGKK
ncbi:MAG: hypothetical protein HYY49_12820 [Ignavibacteriales bacterium]|nr:hypothetical protein [Ignavibacteriales bacterium]